LEADEAGPVGFGGAVECGGDGDRVGECAGGVDGGDRGPEPFVVVDVEVGGGDLLRVCGADRFAGDHHGAEERGFGVFVVWRRGRARVGGHGASTSSRRASNARTRPARDSAMSRHRSA
jgi:hypothetical protein